MPSKKWEGGFIREGIYIIDRKNHRHKVSTRATTRRGALAQLEQYEADPEGYVRGARQRTDLREAIAGYMRHSAAKNSQAHAKAQGSAFDRWLEFLGSRCEAVQDLTAAHAMEFMEWRLAGGGGRPLRPGAAPKSLSEASFNRDFAAMTALLSWARNSDLIREDFNPFRKVHQLKEDRGVRPHHEVARADFLAVREELVRSEAWTTSWWAERGRPGRPRPWADALTVLYGTAMRWGSLARMREEHIDVVKKVLRDPRPKGRVGVEVTVSDEVLAAAQRVVGRLPNDKAAQLDRMLAKVCARAKVDRFTAHDLRVSAATWAHREGTPIRDLQQLLGHADAKTTERYVRAGKGTWDAPI